MTGNNDIQNRLSGISETRKLTNAMYLIASAKLRKAKAELDKTRPYFELLRREITEICSSPKSAGSRYVKSSENSTDGAHGIIVVTGDRGMAGAYNHNVIKTALTEMACYDKPKMFVVGEFGRSFFKKNGIGFDMDFLFSDQEPTFQRAREIRDIVLPLYDSGELEGLTVIYTDTVNGIDSAVIKSRILPVEIPDGYALDEYDDGCEYSPSAAAVIERIIPSYIAGFIYSALVDSFCCEQNSRMMAMEQADKNAGELIDNLLLKYNSARRAAITNEITEVNAGARALKRKGAGR